MDEVVTGYVELNFPKKGGSKREHLEKLQESRDEPIPELQLPPIPEYLEDEWELYWEIKTDSTLTFQEVAAYMATTGHRIPGTMVRNLVRLGRTMDREIAKMERTQYGDGKNKSSN